MESIALFTNLSRVFRLDNIVNKNALAYTNAFKAMVNLKRSATSIQFICSLFFFGINKTQYLKEMKKRRQDIFIL